MISIIETWSIMWRANPPTTRTNLGASALAIWIAIWFDEERWGMPTVQGFSICSSAEATQFVICAVANYCTEDQHKSNVPLLEVKFAARIVDFRICSIVQRIEGCGWCNSLNLVFQIHKNSMFPTHSRPLQLKDTGWFVSLLLSLILDLGSKIIIFCEYLGPGIGGMPLTGPKRV